MVATLNLSAGIHQVEFLHWFTGTAGVYMLVAYEPGAIDEFDKNNFELMPAFDIAPAPFSIIAASRTENQAHIEWTSGIGESYVVERSVDLVDWLELDDGILSEGETTSFSDEDPPASAAYYRVGR